VPAADRLGGDAGADIQRLIDSSRTALAAALVGLSRAVLEYVVPYALEREAFDQAIAQKQGIAFKCADMRIETDACRWLTWKAASKLEQGLDATASSASTPWRCGTGTPAPWVFSRACCQFNGRLPAFY